MKTHELIQSESVACDPSEFLTRQGLATRLRVSLSTVDRMLADGVITPLILGARLARFNYSDVLRDLRNASATAKQRCTQQISRPDGVNLLLRKN